VREEGGGWRVGGGEGAKVVTHKECGRWQTKECREGGHPAVLVPWSTSSTPPPQQRAHVQHATLLHGPQSSVCFPTLT
jgi:hypothetical protein